MSYEVFLSHAEGDSEAARHFEEWLGSLLRTHVFVSSISPGEDFRNAIKKALRKCKLAVVLVTRNSVKREWVHFESGIIRGLRKPLIPVCIGDIKRSELPPTLSDLQACEYGDRDSRKAMVGTIADHLRINNSTVLAVSGRITRAPTLVPGPPEPDDQSWTDLAELFRSCGLANAFRIPLHDPNRGIRVRQLVHAELALKRPRFRLAASSGFNYLHPHGVVWKTGLGDAMVEGRARMTAVLQSPFSVFSVARALANGVRKDQWEDRNMAPQLATLRHHDNVRIRVTGHPVNCSLFFTSKAVFYDPYLWGRPNKAARSENNFWVFEFGKDCKPDYDCYDLLTKHFDFLAGESVVLSEVLGEGDDLKHYRYLQARFSRRLRKARESGKHDFAVAI